MASNINPLNIDTTYPIAGQDNDTQGFRDNFSYIKNNFVVAASEISALQSNSSAYLKLTHIATEMPTATGNVGEVAYSSDNKFLYACAATNTWYKIPMIDWPNFQTELYGNANVAAYLPIDPTITSMRSAINGFVAGTGFSTVAFLQSNVAAINANLITANTAMKGYVDSSNTAMKAYVDGQIISVATGSGFATIGQVNGANAAIVTANVAMKGYVDAQVAAASAGSGLATLGQLQANVTTLNTTIVTANTAMKGYVDNQIAGISLNGTTFATSASVIAANTAMKGYVDAATASLTANAATQQSSISTLQSQVYSNTNVIANLQNLTTNVTTTGVISAGNIKTTNGIFWANGVPYNNGTVTNGRAIVLAMIFGG
jgi:hypothetical protein